jgi:hypothetical protein
VRSNCIKVFLIAGLHNRCYNAPSCLRILSPEPACTSKPCSFRDRIARRVQGPFNCKAPNAFQRQPPPWGRHTNQAVADSLMTPRKRGGRFTCTQANQVARSLIPPETLNDRRQTLKLIGPGAQANPKP